MSTALHPDNMPALVLLAAVPATVTYLLYTYFQSKQAGSNLHALPGPNLEGFSPVLPFKDGADVPGMMELFARWGPVVTLKRTFSRPIAMTTDIKAVTRILQNLDIYDKPPPKTRPLAALLGTGLLVAVGDDHRLQRRILNPAFGPSQLRALTGIFLDKANEMRDCLTDYASSPTPVQVNISEWYSRCSLDIIGLAGFGHDFTALGDIERSEMGRVVKAIIHAGTRKVPYLVQLLLPWFPTLPFLLSKTIKTNVLAMQRIGMELFEERKAKLLHEGTEKSSENRDLLSILIRANLAATSRERMSDKDMRGQIPTFLLAGNETVASLMSWLTYELALRPEIQDRLRQELRSVQLPQHSSGNAALSERQLMALDKLPLLDAVLRESLRMHSPAALTPRLVLKDDVLPLTRPALGSDGKYHENIEVRAGDYVVVPVHAINRSTELFGEDAEQWKPERWTDGTLPEGIKDIPAVWGPVLSFLGGPHACIGYRFALYEMKILLHSLLSTFNFRLAVPEGDVYEQVVVIARAFVKGQEESGPMVPVYLELVNEP